MPPKITAEYLKSQGLSEDFPERFWPKVDKRGPNECWPWKAHIKSVGYGQIARGLPFTGSIGAHVAMHALTKGPVPKGKCVRHCCLPFPDHRWCINPNHLNLGTKGDNNRDTVERGNFKTIYGPGEENRNAVLTWIKVREIREIYKRGHPTFSDTANRFGVSRRLISMIVHNDRWPVETDPINQIQRPS